MIVEAYTIQRYTCVFLLSPLLRHPQIERSSCEKVLIVISTSGIYITITSFYLI